MSAMNARERSPFSQAVADQISAERGRRRLTRKQVYEQAGLTKQTYERIEKGTRVSDSTQVRKIAAVFGMKASELYALAEAQLARDEARSATE